MAHFAFEIIQWGTLEPPITGRFGGAFVTSRVTPVTSRVTVVTSHVTDVASRVTYVASRVTYVANKIAQNKRLDVPNYCCPKNKLSEKQAGNQPGAFSGLYTPFGSPVFGGQKP